MIVTPNGEVRGARVMAFEESKGRCSGVPCNSLLGVSEKEDEDLQTVR